MEIDERENDWVEDVKTKALFDKLNQPNTVLLVKNYEAVRCNKRGDLALHNVLRGVATRRQYEYFGDNAMSDNLPELLFVVAINDLSEMYWKAGEYSLFEVMHEDDNKAVWVNTEDCRFYSRMYPVMSKVNKEIYLTSEDRSTLCFNIRNAFSRMRVRWYRNEDISEWCTNFIHTFIEDHLPDFYDKVECLILETNDLSTSYNFIIDADKLLKSFPNINSIYHGETVKIANLSEHINTFKSFELLEHIFGIARTGDFQTANMLSRRLEAFNIRCAKLLRKVARDYCRRPEDHTEGDLNIEIYKPAGMDHLFHVYLLGWWNSGDESFEEKRKMYVTKYKNIDKAVELLPIRFQNCSFDEVKKKLYWDIKHMEKDESPDYKLFARILMETDRLFPGVIKAVPLEVMQEELMHHLSSLLEKKSK